MGHTPDQYISISRVWPQAAVAWNFLGEPSSIKDENHCSWLQYGRQIKRRDTRKKQKSRLRGRCSSLGERRKGRNQGKGSRNRKERIWIELRKEMAGVDRTRESSRGIFHGSAWSLGWIWCHSWIWGRLGEKQQGWGGGVGCMSEAQRQYPRERVCGSALDQENSREF